jgi:hypothetical protein
LDAGDDGSIFVRGGGWGVGYVWDTHDDG